MKTVYDEWKSYERDIVPSTAGAVQREECRRAFYAGAAAAYYLTLEATVPADEDLCAQNLTTLHEEIQAMKHDLRMA